MTAELWFCCVFTFRPWCTKNKYDNITRIHNNWIFCSPSVPLIKVWRGHLMNNQMSFCHSIGYGGADGAGARVRWQTDTLLCALQRWRQPLWRTHRGGGDERKRQTLETSPILLLLLLFEHLLHRPPQLGLLIHPKCSQPIHLILSGLSTKSWRFPTATAAHTKDSPTGEEEKHGRAQRRRGGARRGRCQRGLS